MDGGRSVGVNDGDKKKTPLPAVAAPPSLEKQKMYRVEFDQVFEGQSCQTEEL